MTATPAQRMSRAASALMRGCATLAGARVSVERDGVAIVVDAVQGKSEFVVESGGGYATVSNDLSLVVTAADLVFVGSLELPQAGWRVTVLDGPKAGQTFEVLSLPGGNCYQELAGGNLLRIHLKRVQ